MLEQRLWHSDKRMFQETFLAGGLNFKLNPAYYRIGPVLEVQPIALLNLRAYYEYISIISTNFGHLQSFSDPSDPYSDELRKSNIDAAYKTRGHHLAFEPALQFKVKNVALRSRWTLEYWDMELQDSDGDGVIDRVFYDPPLDTLIAGQGWVVSNDTDLAYLTGGAMTFGVRYTSVKPRYSAEDFEASSQPEGFIAPSHRRIGPLITYSFNTKNHSWFNRPTLVLVTGFYLQHAFRPIQKPFILLAFAFTSDLLVKPTRPAG